MENSNATATALQWGASSMVALLGFEEEADGSDCGIFGVFASFVYLFIFLYGVSKLVMFSERYIGQHLLCCHNHLNEIRTMSREWEETLQLCDTDKLRLNAEVVILSDKNVQLVGVLAELRNCNLLLIKANFMRSVQLNKTLPTIPSNIFITNTHFHVTRQVFINEGHLSVRNTAGGGSGDVYSEESISNVWMKYLKMRKCYMGPIADRSLVTASGGDLGEELPIIMTTEQLAEMQGII